MIVNLNAVDAATGHNLIWQADSDETPRDPAAHHPAGPGAQSVGTTLSPGM